MTADPFKMNKFNDDITSSSNEPYYQQGYSSLPVSFSNHSMQQQQHLNNSNTRFTNQSVRELNQDSSNINNNQAFIQAHYDANKELIAQLKANIDLLYKGAK